MIRKIFIDGGAHTGESVDCFRRLFPDHNEYEIHSFEPNPDMWALIEAKGVILHKEALWNEDMEREFYKAKFSEGSTLLKKKVSGKVNYRDPINTKCVRLSKWITDSFESTDYIILKLDIEGAEYTVIPDLIESGAYKYIDEWYGELHQGGPEGRIQSLASDEKEKMIQTFKEYKIDFKDWHNNQNNLQNY